MKLSSNRWVVAAVIMVACFRCAIGCASPPEAQRAQLEQALKEFDQAHLIQPDRPDRARQLFRSAAQRFESIVAGGIGNGRLEYNLANSYLQAGELGRAVLHYRRAERLRPRDPLLHNNLREAKSRCLTNIPPTRGSALLKSIFFWHYDTSTRERVCAAGCTYVLLWILLALRSAWPSRSLAISAMFSAGATMVLGGSAAVDSWSDGHAPGGVVTGVDVVVHKGPGSIYQRQFEQPLQQGVEFTRIGERGDWWNIRLPDGHSGWIDAIEADLVAYQAATVRLSRN